MAKLPPSMDISEWIEPAASSEAPSSSFFSFFSSSDSTSVTTPILDGLMSKFDTPPTVLPSPIKVTAAMVMRAALCSTPVDVAPRLVWSYTKDYLKHHINVEVLRSPIPTVSTTWWKVSHLNTKISK